MLRRPRCRSLAAARASSWKTRRTFSSVRCSATTLRVAPTVCSQRAPSLFRSWRVPIEKRAHGRRRHRADDRRILHSFAWRHGKRCAIRCCASAICSDAASASHRSPCSTRPTSRFSQAISSSGRSTPRRSRRRPRSARARARVGSVCMLVSICTLCCTVRRCCSHGSHLRARRYQDGHRYFAEDLCAITVLRQAGELPPIHCPRLSIPAPAFLHTSQPTLCVHRESPLICSFVSRLLLKKITGVT